MPFERIVLTTPVVSAAPVATNLAQMKKYMMIIKKRCQNRTMGRVHHQLYAATNAG